MHKYSEYKDSGVEWIGKIPSHWKISRLRYLHQIMFGGQWGSDPTDSENIVFVVRVSEFDYTRLKISKVPTARKLVIDSTSPKLIRKGDLILEKSGGGEKTPVGRLVMVTDEPIEPTVNSNFTNLIRTNPNKTNSRFLTYLYYVGYIVGITGRNLKQTTGIQNLDTKNLFGELVAVPPIQEQLQISQYLDKKTSQIDSLIEKIERKIELLKEQRTTLISQCVTKGMDPNVEMKDSGVEWIGGIPSHWEISLLKHFSSHINVKRHAKNNENKISPENVESGTGRILDHQSDYENIGMEFEFGDTLLNKLRVYLAKVVFCEFSGLSMGEMIVLRPISIDPKFQFYLLSSFRFIEHLNSLSEGVKMPRTPIDGIMKSRVPITTLHEQSHISQYLDGKTSQIDSLAKKLQRKIELLKEYRQSLISSVVTGKVKVTEDAS